MEKVTVSDRTIRDYIGPLFRQKLIIIITFIVISIGVFISLLFQTPVYEAKVLIHIKGVPITEAATYGAIGPYRIHMTQMAIVTSNPVIKRAVKALDLDNQPPDYEKNFCHPLKRFIVELQAESEKSYIEELSTEEKKEYLLWKAIKNLKDNITTNLKPNTDIFEIVIRDYDPVKAVEIANVVSRSYTIYDLQQQLAELTLKYGDLHPNIQQLQDNIYKMTANLNGKEISDLEAIGTASVKIIEQATTDYIPVGRPKVLLLLIGVIMAGAIGLGLAFVVDMLNMNFKSPQEIAQYLNIPALGTIPKRRLKDKLLISNSDIDSVYMEFYDELCDQIFIFLKVQNLKTLLFVAVNPDNINSAITINIGYALSRNMEAKTLVVDSNMAKPSFQNILKIESQKGFADILEDNNLPINNIKYSMGNNLDILQTGNISQSNTTLLNESKVKPLIKKIRSQFDVVLIDCTFMKKMSDIAMLSSSVDGVVIIINEGKDRIQYTKNVIHVLRQNKANIIGAILNNRTFPIPDWLYSRI
jgi:Mrp family chromosome partitioning ATPase/capsular polysaccharide biosynthesis protein